MMPVPGLHMPGAGEWDPALSADGKLIAFTSNRDGGSGVFLYSVAGDSMVPLVGHTNVKGRPIDEFLSDYEIDGLVKRTRDGGAEIVSLLKTGSAFYAPSSAVCEMLEAVLKDKNEVLPVSAYLERQYGLEDVYCGVPARLGSGGIEEVVEFKLSEEELAALHKSAKQVKEGIDYLKKSHLI